MNSSTQLKQLYITLRISCLIVHKNYNTLSDPPVTTQQDLTAHSQRLIREKNEKFFIGRWGIACPHHCVCWWQVQATRHGISRYFPQ